MIKKLSTKVVPESKRVVLMFFRLNKASTKRVIQMVLSLEEGEVQSIFSLVLLEFLYRHRLFEEILHSNFLRVEKFIPFSDLLSNNRKLLISAYLSKEYSISSAALFNPSMVPHPVQSGQIKSSYNFERNKDV